MRTQNKKAVRRKRLNICSINQLYATIVKVKMFGAYWLNGQDGYFYQIDDSTELNNKENNKYIGYKQPLNFVYRYMQVGYNLHGDGVCYRKRDYNSGFTPLVFNKRFSKR